MLERAPDEISLLDVIEAVDGPLSAGLPMNVGFSGESTARLRDVLCRVTRATREQLAAVKLTHLIADGPARGQPAEAPISHKTAPV